MITNVGFSFTLGQYTIEDPLRVDLQETFPGWLATLEPASLTCHEFGYGATPQEALVDLEACILEAKRHLQATPDDHLGAELLDYKRMLNRCVVSNGTVGVP